MAPVRKNLAVQPSLVSLQVRRPIARGMRRASLCSGLPIDAEYLPLRKDCLPEPIGQRNGDFGVTASMSEYRARGAQEPPGPGRCARQGFRARGQALDPGVLTSAWREATALDRPCW